MIHIDFDPAKYDPIGYRRFAEDDLDPETVALLDSLEVPIEELDLVAGDELSTYLDGHDFAFNDDESA